MAISKKVENALNKQINREIWSAYLYLSMAAYFDSKSLAGCSNWMKIQSKEELSHAMRLYNYLVSRGGRAVMDYLEAPVSEWVSPLEVFEETYEHEQKVTELINNLVETAASENDNATRSMLNWFVDEQVEEEDNASSIVEKIKLVENAPGGIFMIDQELSKRVFNPPADMEL